MRRAAKVDTSQEPIVAALRKAGASVQSLAAVGMGCPDLLVGYGVDLWILECKSPERSKAQREMNTLQQEWAKRWKGKPPVVVLTPEDALRAIGAIRTKEALA